MVRTVGLALAVVLLAACGRGEPVSEATRSGASASPSAAASATTAPAASSTTPPPPGGGPASGPGDGTPAPVPDALVPADAGTWRLEVDASVPVRLDRDHDWGEPVVEGAAVEVTRTAFESDPGYDEYLVRGVEPGRATVTIPTPDDSTTFVFVVD